MLLPSTRSPFGFSEIIRYYRQLAEDGTSPFAEPKTVVSYDPEVLYGDELYFQFASLPEKNAFASDYICQVRLEDLEGKEVATLTTRHEVPGERQDALSEIRFDTKGLIGKAEVLSPVVDVWRVGRIGNERQALFQNLRLPPVILRYNKAQFITSYAIALDKVAPDCELSFENPALVKAQTGSLLQLKAIVKGKEPLRRLSLAESRLNRGAFRLEDADASYAKTLESSFLRIRCENEISYKISLSEGTIAERFANHWDPARTTVKINAPSCESKSFPVGGKGSGRYGSLQDSIGKPNFRIQAPASAKISLTLKGADKPFVETTLKELAAGPLTCSVDADGAKGAVRLELALDAVEQNKDYPLPDSGSYRRSVPVNAYDDATRYFHLWALSESGKVAYSRPLELIKVPKAGQKTVVASPEDPVACQLIHTRGIFDDFVDSSSSSSVNPFDAGDLLAVKLPARLAPYYLYDFEEGAGTTANDGGTAHQLGRAWLSENGCSWIKDGWRGGALKLEGGSLTLRAKSWPSGAYTFSARVKIGGKPKEDAPLAGDGDFWQGIAMQGLRIDLLPDGRVRALRQIRDCEGKAVSADRLADGWNHVAITHDLQAIRIYINGKLSGEGKVSKPGYMRTHSTPSIAFSRVEQSLKAKDAPASSFTGELDQLEIIGTALSSEDVAKLYELGQWLPR
jgi:hypothetical protein